MTEAMPFLQKTILLSYDPRPFTPGALFWNDNVNFTDPIPPRGWHIRGSCSTGL